MWPNFWPTFLQSIDGTHPEVAAWLNSIRPMKNNSPLSSRLVSRLLKDFREYKSSAYQRSCSVF